MTEQETDISMLDWEVTDKQKEDSMRVRDISMNSTLT